MVGAKILFWEPFRGQIPSEKEIQRDQNYENLKELISIDNVVPNCLDLIVGLDGFGLLFANIARYCIGQDCWNWFENWFRIFKWCPLNVLVSSFNPNQFASSKPICFNLLI